jgi:hypothetical protein
VTLVPEFLDPAKAYEESGLYFDPPHARAFRLDRSLLADSLFKSFGVQEMDFGWWDEPQQTMNLLEVKDYSEAYLNPEHYLNECIQKATDCLLVLASIWYNLPYGLRARDCFPDEWHMRPSAPPRLHLYFVKKSRSSMTARATQDTVGIDALQAQARNKLRGRLELLQVRQSTTLFLMDHSEAVRRGLPIKTEEDLVGAAGRVRAPRPRKR